ncbi:glycosyl transferase, group 2 family protein [Paenibacillus sp. FSL R7-277]|uniref:glycosyltransferase family 2 protein n=1 Tax=unclassified Paenibacillus TaxID=185978 RepID=UPI0003E2B1E6|nr:glycosyltransferase family 2 protein [Paenibacillus sp. FSL R7-277]ETT74628.1 glycosyl transferase, group 2 family protein [Paenibacillus sp. FSL R7-277]
MNQKIKRVLLGSPIHQKPEILEHFLKSLQRLNLNNIELHYYLIDDNGDTASSELLQQFAQSGRTVFLESSGYHDDYIRDDNAHAWRISLVWKVAEFKNQMIRRAEAFGYDYLFLVDSDLILHPSTLEQLISSGKDIIAEVFWTQWQPGKLEQPQVWMHDEYNQWEALPGEKLSPEEIKRRLHAFLLKMRQPGIYEVGGLGACTLISTQAIKSGVSYKKVRNLSYWGEDRHFCIRAAALDIPLFVDTHYPALHLYRDSDLDKVEEFVRQSTATPGTEPSEHDGKRNDEELERSEEANLIKLQAADAAHATTPAAAQRRPKLTLTMIVKNEASRFLQQILEEHRKYIDEAVIIDDGSTDGTAELVKEVLGGIPLKLIHNPVSRFNNESELRKQQWEAVVETGPEWILNLDGDEMFESGFAEEVDSLLRTEDCDLFCFRLYDFWDDNHYREDKYWRAHLRYRPFLVRYRQDFTYLWNDLPQHSGRLPENIWELPHQLSNLRIKHLGWSKQEFRLEKYIRYMQLDPDGKYGWKEQYQSILDEHPRLLPWSE